MPIAYQVRVYNTAGALQTVIDRFRTVHIEHTVNGVSSATIGLYELDPSVEYFTLDALVEIRRRYPEAGLDWYTEFIGFHRTPQRQITLGDTRIFTSYCRGLLDLIRRRSVRYYADTDGSAKGPGPADDIIKAYVRENAGSLATVANGRLSAGVTLGLTVAADLSESTTFEGADAWKNLLQTIQDIGEPHNVDFDVVWTGGASFDFRTYYPQLGTDRREGGASPFVFAPELGNITNPSHTLSRTDEVSSVLVLGPGEGPWRDTTLIVGPTLSDSPWNVIEQDQNASSEDREHAIHDIGRDVLYEKRAAVNMTFEVIQTPSSAYGRHYFLGDIVTARFSSVTSDVKIRGAAVTVSENSETISLELEEYTEDFSI